MDCIGSIIIFYKIDIHVGLYFVDLELIIIDYFNFVKDLDRVIDMVIMSMSRIW